MEPKLWIPPATFEAVVENTPLVSIDLVITKLDTMFVGMRKNRPAKDTYFVPGGRICKDETIEQAFHRIAKNEMGLDIDIKDARFMGVFEHFYPDSTLNADCTTHYVVLAYHLTIRDREIDSQKVQTQHNGFKFMNNRNIIDDDSVHENTKVYARILKGVYPHKRK